MDTELQLQKLNLDSSAPASAAPTTPVTPPPDIASGKPAEPAAKQGDRPRRLSAGKLLKILLPIILVLLVLGLSLGIPAYIIAKPLQATVAFGRATMNSIQAQNLDEAKKNLEETRNHLAITQSKYAILSWVKLVPLARNYYLDGDHALKAAAYSIEAGDVLIEAIKPYADLLGFKTNEASAAAQVQSAEDKIVFLVQTLDTISPQLDQINDKLKLAQQEIDQINPNHYPANLAGKPVRGKILGLKDAFSSTTKVLLEARPLIKLLPELLAQDAEKVYMLLFQNDAELRPTGGFMTAYAYLKVHKGKITPLDSNDIYELDDRFVKRIPAPDPIKKYLKEDRWYLRNMNISPDFKVSMDTFYKYYKETPTSRNIDGIIAMDTQVPVKLLEILGPVGVGGWGTFSAENDKRCDCPQVIYALEEIADRPTNKLGRTDRKAVLGPLMHSILANAMGSPKSKWPQFINVGLEAIKQKHFLFYFLKEEAQIHAESFNAGGRITEFSGDYLHINDSNFGGAKSNMFTSQEVEQDYEVGEDGTITKTVTLVYNNPFPASNCNLEAGQLCLNGTLRDWVRLYVPKGSQLIEVTGSEDPGNATEDLDKTVFDAFFTLRPQSSSKLVFKYQLPLKADAFDSLLVQKQPGKPRAKYTIVYDGQTQTKELDTDLEIRLK